MWARIAGAMTVKNRKKRTTKELDLNATIFSCFFFFFFFFFFSSLSCLVMVRSSFLSERLNLDQNQNGRGLDGLIVNAILMGTSVSYFKWVNKNYPKQDKLSIKF